MADLGFADEAIEKLFKIYVGSPLAAHQPTDHQETDCGDPASGYAYGNACPVNT